MIYTFDETKKIVESVAVHFDIEQVWLFGSYFDDTATETSDVDLLVKYGDTCRGLTRIRFINSLEEQLYKKIDVINIDFAPHFVKKLDLTTEKRLVYRNATLTQKEKQP